MNVTREDEDRDMMVYDRMICVLITESCGDKDEAEKILNDRPDEKNSLIRLRQKLTKGISPFSPKNTIFNKIFELFVRKTLDRGTFSEIMLSTFYPDPDYINDILDATEGMFDGTLFSLSEELYYWSLKNISESSSVFVMILNNPGIIRKKYQPSKFLDSIFLNRFAEDGYIDRLRIWDPKPHSYQLILTLVQLIEVVFEEDYVISEMTLSAAKKWLDENEPIRVKSARKQ